MNSPRAIPILAVAALAAACWDGNLDPVLGGGGDADADTDADADADGDTDTGGDSETEPTPCGFDLSIELWSEYSPTPWISDTCEYTFAGECMANPSGCAGCAWYLGEDGSCADGQVCCVEEFPDQPCATYWESDLHCGHQDGACTTWYDESVLPVCPAGSFCCWETFED
jgi:hypothetical protein